jgi:hypothetical protein
VVAIEVMRRDLPDLVHVAPNQRVVAPYGTEAEPLKGLRVTERSVDRLTSLLFGVA